MEEPERTPMPSPAYPLTISATVSAGQMVVELVGDADIESVPVLQAGMAVLAEESAAEVVIDLGGLSFLSPHGLSVLVRCAHRMEASSQWVEFRRPSPQVRRMLEWTGGPLRLARD